jgi:hypothetical protein
MEEALLCLNLGFLEVSLWLTLASPCYLTKKSHIPERMKGLFSECYRNLQ